MTELKKKKITLISETTKRQETAVFWTTERNGGIWSLESRIPGSRGIEEHSKKTVKNSQKHFSKQ